MKLPEDTLELTTEDIIEEVVEETTEEAAEAPEATEEQPAEQEAPRTLVGSRDPNTGLFMLKYEDTDELFGQYTKASEADAAYAQYNEENGIETE